MSEDNDDRSMAQKFAEDEMVFNDVPSTLTQNITDGYIVFSDGSYLVCRDWQIYGVSGPDVFRKSRGEERSWSSPNRDS